MGKKNIPIIIMLLAGLVNCLLCMGRHMSNLEFVTRLLIVFVVFFLFGLLIRFLANKGIELLGDKNMEEENQQEEETSVEETQEIEE